ncbi:hypothetical protein BH18ACI3_BH18ACI3_18910 [soil metagenome]
MFGLMQKGRTDVSYFCTISLIIQTIIPKIKPFSQRIIYGNLRLTRSIMPVVKCPKCGKEAEYNGNEFRPFCSERCQLLDFGAWADEEYNLPSETSSMTDEEIDAIEKALKEKENL